MIYQYWEHFNIFGLSGFQRKGQSQKKTFFESSTKKEKLRLSPRMKKSSQRSWTLMNWQIRKKSKKSAVRWLFRKIKIPPQVTHDFLRECFFTKVWLSNEILMEEAKAVSFEKLELENWDKSNLIAFLWTSGRSGNWHMDENEWFRNQNLINKCDVYDSGSDRRNQTSSCWESIWKSRVMAFFGDFGQSGFWRRAQNHRFFDEVLLAKIRGFWLRNRWNNWVFCFRRKSTCIMKEIQYELRFLVVPQFADHRTTCSSNRFSKWFFWRQRNYGSERYWYPKIETNFTSLHL